MGHDGMGPDGSGPALGGPEGSAQEGVALRRLRAADLPAAQALSASFGWPHRLEDWAFMRGLGEGIAAEADGALIGTAMGWRYGREGGAIGMIAVAAAHQGRGIGRRMVAALIGRLGTRRLELHATEAGAPLYRSLGFAPAGRIRQHQGAAFAAGLLALPAGARLRPIGRSDPAVLLTRDRAASGMDRGRVLRAMLPGAFGMVLDQGGVAAGFALMRRFGRGHVIGPVVAADAPAARALIGHFLAANPGQLMRIDVPEESGLSPWLEALGLAEAGTALRMLRGAPARPSGPDRGFALISQAFG